MQTSEGQSRNLEAVPSTSSRAIKNIRRSSNDENIPPPAKKTKSVCIFFFNIMYFYASLSS